MDTEKAEMDIDIYINVEDLENQRDVCKGVYSNTELGKKGCEPALEERSSRSGKTATVCLGMLCVILLAVIIGLCIKHKAERVQLLSSYYNVFLDRDQLQGSYYNLSVERSLLQVRFDNLTSEKEELQKKLSNTERVCPDGWIRFMSSCYYVSNILNTWKQSTQDCMGKQSKLVIINSNEEQNFVSGLASNFWIGLLYNNGEQKWKWVDGTSLQSGFWINGELNFNQRTPSLALSMVCAQVISGTRWSTSYNWKSVPCDYRSYSICEKMVQCQL